MIKSINELAGNDQPLEARIVTWELNNINVSHSVIVAALEAADLDKEVARTICTTDGFRRAIHKLDDDRVIRKLRADKDYIQFQFTREENVGGERIDYNFEAVVTLNIATGQITCAVPEIETRAQAALDSAIANRTTADVTRIVQKLFEKEADLFKLRSRGGAYLIAEEKAGICDKVDAFLRSINGELTQFTIVAKNDSTSRSIKQTVQEGLADLVSKLKSKIENLDEKARGHTLESRATEINELRFKLDGYAAYLDTRKEELEGEISELTLLLSAKVARIAGASDESEESPAAPVAEAPVEDEAPAYEEPAVDQQRELAFA